MEQFANNCNTTIAAGGYTAGSGVLNVVSTGAPFPQVGNFSISIYDAATKALKVILTVTAINSETQFAVTAEGSDANANVDDIVRGGMLTSRVLKNIGWVLLEEKTANDSETLDFAAWASALYDEYIIELVHITPVTNASSLLLRFSTDGGVNYNTTAANYKTSRFYYYTTNHAAVYDTASSAWVLRANVGNTTEWGGVVGSVKLFDPFNASIRLLGTGLLCSYQTDVSNSMVTNSITMECLNYYTINALRFLFSTGNIASGTIRIYGMAK
jgi:hypothetical protein